jgi:starch synthase
MATKKQTKPIKNIWMVTREYNGLAGTGGVKDVCRQLAEALARAKRKVSVVLPFYGFMDSEQDELVELDISFDLDMNYVNEERRESLTIWQRQYNGVTLYLIDAERYREKKGIYTYTAEEELENPYHQQGTAYQDYFAMNILLQKATLALCIILAERPDVIHCQDAHTAVLPAIISENEGYRHYFRNTGALVTIHNAGHGYHQEVGDLPFARTISGLPYRYILDHLLDGKFNPFLAASSSAVLNTVSENYARELQETDDDIMTGWLGHRLLTRGVHLEGITNGINPGDFTPGCTWDEQAEGKGTAANFDPAVGDLAGKRKCKETLLRAIGKKDIADIDQIGTLKYTPDQPLFTMIGRLMTQKGVDVLVAALQKLLAQDLRFQVLIQGTGAREIEEALTVLAEDKKNQGRICVMRGYNDSLANRIYAAGDFFLIPSQYEPCGLTDFIAQLAGNLPIVHHVGGLVKVADGVTGFAYQDHSPEALMAAMLRAMQVFRDQPAVIRKMQKAAVLTIQKSFTWDKVMKHYLRLYRDAVDLRRVGERERLAAMGLANSGRANMVLNEGI